MSDNVQANIGIQSIPLTPETTEVFREMVKKSKNSADFGKNTTLALEKIGVLNSKKNEEVPQVAKQATPEKKIVEKKEEEVNEEETEESVNWREEYLKVESAQKETRNWANEVNKQNVAYRKNVEQLVENNALSEDQAKNLLSHLKENQKNNKQEDHILYRLGNVWDQEFENIKKYGNEPNIDKYLQALRHFFSHSPVSEINDFLEEVVPLMEEDPIACTKKALEYAKTYHEEIYDEYSSSGNLKNFKNKFKTELDEKQKVIDKQKKEILSLKSKLGSYDESPQMITENSGNSGDSGITPYSGNLGQIASLVNRGKIKFQRR
jgi:hypothetical protein